MIVVHNISLPPGEFGGPWVDHLFTNTLPRGVHPYFDQIVDNRVSAHLLINRRGEVTQYVPFHRCAWHAGQSSFLGREACNGFSIGIELEGTDELPFEPVQYGVLAAITKELIKAYPLITRDRIVGHSDIAPHRKTDPGPCFNWNDFHCILHKLSA
jgi:AmpD protein